MDSNQTTLIVLGVILITSIIVIMRDDEPNDEICKQSPNQVILLSASWCGYCDQARELFETRQIAFVEYDVETTDEGKRLHSQSGGGGVPKMCINGTLMEGYNQKMVLNLLNPS